MTPFNGAIAAPYDVQFTHNSAKSMIFVSFKKAYKCDFVLDIRSNLCPISHRFRDTASFFLVETCTFFLGYPHSIEPQISECSLELHRRSFAHKEG